jgi:hypothetical protein
VVELQKKWNFVRILSCNRAQNTERAGHRIAPTFNRELDDVFWIEVQRVGRERRACRVLNALVHRENGNKPGSRKPSGIRKLAQTHQCASRPIRQGEVTVDEVRPGQMKVLFGNRLALMFQQRRIRTQNLLNLADH